MKLLFDQNISFRVKERLIEIFPEARHVKDFNLQFATDHQIREFARINGYDVITFDADFYDLATLFGPPPKIIWLRIGKYIYKKSSGNIAKSCFVNSQVFGGRGASGIGLP